MQSPLSCGNSSSLNCKKCGKPRQLNKACIEALRKTCEPPPKPQFQINKEDDTEIEMQTKATESETKLATWRSILFDIIGAFAFFIMVTTIFWITASFYVRRLLVELYYAPRNTQLIVVSILALLLVSFTIHATIATRAKRAQALLYLQIVENQKSKGNDTQTTPTPTTTPQKSQHTSPLPTSTSRTHRAQVEVPLQIWEKNRIPFFRCGRKKSTDSRLKGGGCKKQCPPGKSKSHMFCPKYDASKCKKPPASNLCLTLADKATNTPMSDEEGFEIFRNYRTYSYPLDMKAPPALLIYLRDYIFHNFCLGDQNSRREIDS